MDASSCYDAIVRTTIELSPEAYHVAKAVARERNQSLGKVVSDFILKRAAARIPESAVSRAGFPVFASGQRVTSEDVQALLDEDLETT